MALHVTVFRLWDPIDPSDTTPTQPKEQKAEMVQGLSFPQTLNLRIPSMGSYRKEPLQEPPIFTNPPRPPT